MFFYYSLDGGQTGKNKTLFWNSNSYKKTDVEENFKSSVQNDAWIICRFYLFMCCFCVHHLNCKIAILCINQDAFGCRLKKTLYLELAQAF